MTTRTTPARQNSSKNFAKNFRKFLLPLAVMIAPHLAAAQDVTACDWRARADAIPEPWEAHTRTFANGEVRVALIDRIEPAAGALYLLILHPPRMELGERHCTLIGFAPGIGYAGLDFSGLGAGYDPARGLTLSLPGRLYDPESSFTNPLILHATINQATGQVLAEHELGRE